MMTLTLSQLKNIYKECPEERLRKWLPHLVDTMEQFEINTPQRMRMFLAQIGHESGQLRYTEELASGDAYEGRRDLGNTQKGDGRKYKGRGLIQITGKTNYLLCGMDLNLPLLEQPELLKDAPWAALSAGWYWDERRLNALCDLGLFEKLTKAINGGLNGYADRYKLYQRALEAI